MFFETFFDILKTHEFIIVLLIILILFPLIFAIASRSKKNRTIRRVPKTDTATEKKSLKLIRVMVYE
jgi:hypothetical protein